MGQSSLGVFGNGVLFFSENPSLMSLLAPYKYSVHPLPLVKRLNFQ